MTQVVIELGGAMPEEDVVGEDPVARRGRWSAISGRAAALPGAGTWTGVLLSTAGLALVVLAWGRTAGLTNVALQVPYVISAGLSGLGLVVVGLTVVSVSARRADALARRQQLEELQALVAELRAALEARR